MASKMMNQQIAGQGVARLANVGLALAAMKQIMSAKHQMPRIAVLSGTPGLGKSQAAMYMAHPLSGINAAYVQLRMFDTTKTLSQLIATELDVRWKTGWSTAQMFEATCERLVQMDRPLVVDEVDHIAEKSSVDYIRALHDQCSTPIFLIGEESLKTKLLGKHERFHDRVLTWVTATPCDTEDAALLTAHYAPELAWDDTAIDALVKSTSGVARRISTEIERIKEDVKRKGLDKVTVDVVMARGARR